MERNNRKITFKNYFIVLIVSVLTILLVVYLRSFIINYRANVSNVSIFKDKVKSIKTNDLEYIIPEAGEIVLYVSYTGNVKISSMEKTLYKKIENKGIKEKFIYLDVTDHLDNLEYINILKERFPSVESQINTAPLFIYIEEGKAVEAMSSELKLIDYKVLNKISEKYEIE